MTLWLNPCHKVIAALDRRPHSCKNNAVGSSFPTPKPIVIGGLELNFGAGSIVGTESAPGHSDEQWEALDPQVYITDMEDANLETDDEEYGMKMFDDD